VCVVEACVYGKMITRDELFIRKALLWRSDQCHSDLQFSQLYAHFWGLRT
jgi:hypothetical protein